MKLYILEVYLKPSLGESAFISAASCNGTKVYAKKFNIPKVKTIVDTVLGV